MKSQPNRNYLSDDDVQTPIYLARKLVKHFSPSGKILEPCRGDGNIWSQMLPAYWCEIKEDKDFFDWTKEVDWIVSNPPWSRFRDFLWHAMKVADNIVFLITINHIWTKARLRDLKEKDFGIKEISLVRSPSNFPQSGFQLGAIHFSLGWRGKISLTNL